METAIVVGKLWSTVKNRPLEGKRILALRQVDGEKKPFGDIFFALDGVGVGEGEYVVFVRGYEASHCFLPNIVPTDATVIAKIDEIAK